MVFHRHHHGPLHSVRNVGWSRDEQEISTWHAASHHALLFGYTIPPERAPAPAAHAASHTKRYRGSMQLHMRLGAPSDEPCQRVERHLRIAMQRQLVHLVERGIHNP